MVRPKPDRPYRLLRLWRRETDSQAGHRIQLMKEGDDVEDYIRSFKSLMRQEAVPDGKWKQVLLSAIPRYKALIEEVMMDEDSTYQQVVYALLDCGGLNHMRAADLFWMNKNRNRRDPTWRKCFTTASYGGWRRLVKEP